MTFPTAPLNTMLDALTITHASLHTSFPGATGANEVTGGSPAYARETVVINSGSGGQRLLNSAIEWDIPACTVRWIGFWNDSSFLFCAPNGGATPKNFMAIASSDLIYAAAHGYSDTQKITFYGVPPTGLTEGVTYFVRDATTDSFSVAATSGGSVIDLTAASSFGCVVIAITEEVYASQDTHVLSVATLAIPT
jgi:hypothetical protein